MWNATRPGWWNSRSWGGAPPGALRDRATGLLNVGSEDEKGHDDVKGAHRILRETAPRLHHRGFVEGTDISKGTVDVVVTDGFTGNVVWKPPRVWPAFHQRAAGFP